MVSVELRNSLLIPTKRNNKSHWQMQTCLIRKLKNLLLAMTFFSFAYIRLLIWNIKSFIFLMYCKLKVVTKNHLKKVLYVPFGSFFFLFAIFYLLVQVYRRVNKRTLTLSVYVYTFLFTHPLYLNPLAQHVCVRVNTWCDCIVCV